MTAPTQRPRRPAPILAALALSVLFLVAVFRVVPLRSDMADFLPRGDTPAARLMLRELRSGTAASLILIGLDGAPPTELARIAREMAASLDRSGGFAFVAGASSPLDGPDEAVLFRHRYLLSPATIETAFTTEALRGDLDRLLRGLRSSASPLLARYGFADPTGAFLGLAREWMGSSRVRVEHGVWFAADRDRALLLARSRAGGMDVAAQDEAVAAIRAAHAAARPGGSRLLLAGPALFARDAAASIRGDVEFLSTISALLIGALLFWRFRSPWVVAAVAVPVLIGLGVAAIAVRIAFGFVHGAAFGFGMTMLGVTVDYPVLLIGHRKGGEPAAGTVRRIGATLALAVASAALGLTGMALSRFPGLAQLGVFSVAGVLATAAATRWLLPRLIVAADLAPVAAGDPARLLRIEALRHWRGWAALPVVLAAIVLVLRPPRWERDLDALSPVPAASRALDAELRAELGAPEAGQVVVLRGPDAETVLRAEEALAPRLDRLRAEGVIAGAEYAARLLPSVATQRTRQAALPAAEELASRLETARAGTPFRAAAFAPFLDDVAASRALPPLRLAELSSPVLAARLGSLLVEREDGWYGLVAPQGVTDPARLAAALAGTDALPVDMRAETGRMVAEATQRARLLVGVGGLAVLLVLVAGLRDPARVARVVAAVAAATLVTLAVLALSGAALSLVHLVSLQFVAGVGLDYALFFARPNLDREERARTLRTLVTCNTMTLFTFGLLAFCRTKLLRDIGSTVSIGAFSAMLFAFLIAAPRPGRA